MRRAKPAISLAGGRWETRDVEFKPARGEYRLVVGDPKQAAWVQVLLAR